MPSSAAGTSAASAASSRSSVSSSASSTPVSGEVTSFAPSTPASIVTSTALVSLGAPPSVASKANDGYPHPPPTAAASHHACRMKTMLTRSPRGAIRRRELLRVRERLLEPFAHVVGRRSLFVSVEQLHRVVREHVQRVP